MSADAECSDDETGQHAPAELTWLATFQDPALEARFRRQHHKVRPHFSSQGAGVAAVLAFSVAVRVAFTLLSGGAWTVLETSYAIWFVPFLGLSALFSSAAFERLSDDTRMNITCAFLVFVAAYQPLHSPFRLATLAGDKHRDAILANTDELWLGNLGLSVRTALLLFIVVLLQLLDVKRFALVLGAGLLSLLLWHELLPMPGGDFRQTMACHLVMLLYIIATQAQWNRVARITFHHLSEARLLERERAAESAKVSAAEAARHARSRLIRVVRACAYLGLSPRLRQPALS